MYSIKKLPLVQPLLFIILNMYYLGVCSKSSAAAYQNMTITYVNYLARSSLKPDVYQSRGVCWGIKLVVLTL